MYAPYPPRRVTVKQDTGVDRRDVLKGLAPSVSPSYLLSLAAMFGLLSLGG